MNNNDNNFGQKDLTGMFDTNDIQQNIAVTIIGYIPPLFFIPLIVSPESRYAKFHANQGLIVTIIAVACAMVMLLVGLTLGRIPFIGILFDVIVDLGLSVVMIGAVIIGIINAAEGRAKKLPILGDIEIIK